MNDPRKVIQGLECWLDDDTHCPDDDCPYMKGLVCDQAAILQDAISMLKSLEPKPVIAEKNFNNYEFYHCPKCGRDFYGPYKRPNYCDRCGQAVKWE